MAKQEKSRGVHRLIERGAIRSPAIGIDELPRAVQRLAERQDGIALNIQAEKGSAQPQPAQTPRHQGGPDMRSELVRKVVEMAQLQRSQDIEQLARAANLEQWYQDMRASGLSEPEIEEHMAQRLRSVRASMLEFGDLRSVGGKH